MEEPVKDTEKETFEQRPARDERVNQVISKRRFVLANVPQTVKDLRQGCVGRFRGRVQ